MEGAGARGERNQTQYRSDQDNRRRKRRLGESTLDLLQSKKLSAKLLEVHEAKSLTKENGSD